MLKKMVVVVALGAMTVCAFASETDARNAAAKVVDMQDGSIVYIFKGGKMAVESNLGHVVRTKAGTVMKTKDGQDLTMVGDEMARLDLLLKKGTSGSDATKESTSDNDAGKNK